MLDQLSLAGQTALLALSSRRDPPAPGTPDKILFLGYAAIGDLLFFLPVVQALRARFPKARLVWLANDYPTTRELLPATGLIDEFWLHDWEGPGAAAGRAGINARVRAAGFDWAVLTAASPAHYFQESLAGIPTRAGHLRRLEPAPPWRRLKKAVVSGEWARRILINRPVWAELAPEHALRRNLRLLEALGLRPPFDDRPAVPLPEAARTRARAELPDGPWIGVHVPPAADQYGKVWAPERVGAACAELAKTARARFVFLAAEAGAAERSRARIPGLVDLSGRLTLLETFAAIERCALFFASDTGLAKAAMALGVPTATIFGPVDPAEFGTIWEPEKHLEIRTGIACSPCARLGMPLLDRLNFTSCGHRACINGLEVSLAVGALRGRYRELLGEP